MRAETPVPEVLVAIDGGPAAPLILDVATAVGAALSAPVRAVHVGSELPRELHDAARRAGVELRLVEGDPVTALARELERPEVGLAVLGCREHPDRPLPAGHVPLALIARSSTPIVVVPPLASAPSDGLSHVLLPLDGSDEATDTVEATVAVLAGSGLRLVVAHVFDADHVPPFLDQPHHALEAWGREFLARHADADLDLALRAGPPGTRLLDVATAHDADLIVLGWSQELSQGRATTIQHLLAESRVPLLLVPASGRTGEDGDRARRPAPWARARSRP